jgi:hypothetical protein
MWKKKRIFFRLSYWKDNLLRHNHDVMYIEKNVVNNILGTILDIKGKTKDNIEARKDLCEMVLRPTLHPLTSRVVIEPVSSELGVFKLGLHGKSHE